MRYLSLALILVSQLFAQTPCESIGPVPFQQNGKWGYLTDEGVVIALQFDIATPFTADGAIACAGKICGRINTMGEFLPPTWSPQSRPFPEKYSEGLSPVSSDGKWGYIDFQRRLVVPFEFLYAGQFMNGIARVRLGDKFFFINKTGNRITPEFEGAFDFHEGLAAIQVANKVGYIRPDGSLAISADHGSASGVDFSEGLAAVRVKGKVGFMDRSGNIVIEPKYDDVYPFSDGLAAVELHEQWGYVDHEGKLVVPIRFHIAHMFSEQVASVNVDEKWGFINRNGEFAIAPQFDSALPFCGGVAAVETYRVVGKTTQREELHEGKHGMIDHQGKYVWRDPHDVTWGSGFQP